MQLKPLQTRQAGFTLVELVIVILILGILSAVALPKFLDMGANARAAKLDAMFGAVRAASAIVHAGALVNGTASAATGTIVVEGVTINLVYGYPEASIALLGIVRAAGIDTTVNNYDKVTLAAGPPVLIQINGAATPANCQISYAAATAVIAPVITKTGTSCA